MMYIELAAASRAAKKYSRLHLLWLVRVLGKDGKEKLHLSIFTKGRSLSA